MKNYSYMIMKNVSYGTGLEETDEKVYLSLTKAMKKLDEYYQKQTYGNCTLVIWPIP